MPTIEEMKAYEHKCAVILEARLQCEYSTPIQVIPPGQQWDANGRPVHMDSSNNCTYQTPAHYQAALKDVDARLDRAATRGQGDMKSLHDLQAMISDSFKANFPECFVRAPTSQAKPNANPGYHDFSDLR